MMPGASTIRYLLRQGRLDFVGRDRDPTEVAEAALHAAELDLDFARQRMTSVGRLSADDDPATVYALAYDVYRLSATALLAGQGLRATGGEGGHMAVEDAVSAQFGDAAAMFAKPVFERLRRTRHSAEYPDPTNPPFTAADAAWALDKAAEALAFSSKTVTDGGLTLFPTEE